MPSDVLVSHRGGLKLKRRLMSRVDGLIGLAQDFAGSATKTLVTHDAFLVTTIETLGGELSFPLRSGRVIPPARFVLVVPPRSVLPMEFVGATITSTGFAGFHSCSIQCPAFLPVARDFSCRQLAEIAPSIGMPGTVLLRADVGAPAYLREARALLHNHIGELGLIGRVANEIGVAPETLSREFQSAYNISPKTYVNKARLFQAVLKILIGRSILESSLDSGFGDLKRFYVQFRKHLQSTPGQYRKVRKRQDV